MNGREPTGRSLIPSQFLEETRFPPVTADPDDNIVVEAAHSGRVDYVVTGDRKLLALKEFKGIEFVTVDDMLRMLRR